jgi:hypothetical protein
MRAMMHAAVEAAHNFYLAGSILISEPLRKKYPRLISRFAGVLKSQYRKV